MKHIALSTLFTALVLCAGHARATDMPIFDAHIHYSHDAWEQAPPAEAIAILRKAGLKYALVSSSGDEGTQRLAALAPDLVLPALRPYRMRGETSSWMRDESVVRFLEDRLSKSRYVAIGEFHLYGKDADLPVPRRMVALAKQYKLVLHAHSDADAVNRIFQQYPEARVIWAHSGFDHPELVSEQLRKHKNLWSDLASRTDHGSGASVPASWRSLFEEFPDRFMVGSDTYTPERWHYIGEHAKWSRAWLGSLPRPLAEKIAWRNAETLFANYLPKIASVAVAK
jgi:predicted TIM-barrel fold metal-dependent hydrolase